MVLSDQAWSCCGVPFRGDDGWIISDWLYHLDHLDCFGWIVSVSVLGLLGETGFYALAGLLMDGWDWWTGWDAGGMEVGWRYRRQQAPERERHHWLLRGDGWWDSVPGTNCVSAERAQIICIGAEK